MTTLIYCLLILSISTLLVFTVSRSSHYEQQFMANEYWSSQGFYASDAAMHYVRVWLTDNTPAWHVGSQYLTATMAIPTISNQQSMVESFTSQAFFQSDPLTPEYIEINIKTISSAQDSTEFSSRVLVKRQPANGHAIITQISGSWRDF